MTIQDLPTINAALNGTAAILLFFGWRAIRRGDRPTHKRFMLAALGVSAAFMACYLYYHYNIGAVTKYQGRGLLRGIYFFVLATHIPLATLVVPGSLLAVWFAMRGQFNRHTRVTRWLWLVWMYVSVTGVLIYLMLYVLPGGVRP